MLSFSSSESWATSSLNAFRSWPGFRPKNSCNTTSGPFGFPTVPPLSNVDVVNRRSRRLALHHVDHAVTVVSLDHHCLCFVAAGRHALPMPGSLMDSAKRRLNPSGICVLLKFNPYMAISLPPTNFSIPQFKTDCKP